MILEFWIFQIFLPHRKNWEFSHEMRMKDFRIHCCKSRFKALVSFCIEMLNIASCWMDLEDFCMVREIMKSAIKLSTLQGFLSVSKFGQNAVAFGNLQFPYWLGLYNDNNYITIWRRNHFLFMKTFIPPPKCWIWKSLLYIAIKFQMSSRWYGL